MFVECFLCLGGLMLVPGLETGVGIFRERAVVINLKHLVHEILDRFQPEREVYYRSHARGDIAHEVGVGEQRVAQRRTVVRVLDACGLDYVADFDIVGTCHLAPLAVKTVFQCLVVEIWTLQPVSLTIWTGLLRSRIIGIDSRHRTVNRTDCTLYARLEIIVAYILLL